ncbi:MAG: hypothetical protein ACC655_09420 [Rhodothermia bacterium]
MANEDTAEDASEGTSKGSSEGTSEGTSPEGLRKLSQWLDQPLTAGKEKELNEWLANGPDHQVSWDRWTQFNLSAKRLQIVPSPVGSEWTILRDELGFKRSTRKRSKQLSKPRKHTLLRRPLVVATLSTIAFALFLSLLYLIRTSAAF